MFYVRSFSVPSTFHFFLIVCSDNLGRGTVLDPQDLPMMHLAVA
jgi:hypothetical protein